MPRVYIGDSPAQAHLVAGLLEEAGIPCVVEGDMLTGARFGLGADASSLPSVSVSVEDFDRARTVVREQGRAPREQPSRQEEAGTESAEGADEVPAERRSVRRFKWFLVLWLFALPLILGLLGLAWYSPWLDLAIVLAIVIVVFWPRRRAGRAR